MCTIFSIRGEKFRTEFSHLNEVRSIIPETVRVMALRVAAHRLRNFLLMVAMHDYYYCILTGASLL